MLRSRSAIMAIVLGALLSVCSYAQQNGSIVGTVTDPSGAVVPGAKVTAVNSATGFTRSTVTTSAGAFTVSELPAATYTVTVEKSGFQKSVSADVTVNVATASNLSITLRVGSTTQSVQVTAAPALLQTTTTSTGKVMTTQAILQLPLSVSGGLRNNLQFVALTPGVQWSPGNDLSLKISGGQDSASSFLLDGSETMSTRRNEPDFQAVSTDAIAEFKVETGSYSAEYGRTGNGIINLVTKSGTNQLHGSLFDYFRNTALNARGFYAAKTPVSHQNDFGGTVGGPIYIPHVYNGKDKSFFFFSFEKSIYVAGSPSGRTSVPTMQERNGDFRDWVDASGNLIPVYDPSTTRIVSGQVVRDQVSCNGALNVICPDRIVSQATLINSLLPAPQYPGLFNNINVVGNNGATQRVYSFQFDNNLTPKDHTMFLFSSQMFSPPIAVGPIPGPLGSNFESSGVSHYYRFTYDHIFSPTLLNHLALGLNRRLFLEFPGKAAPNDLTAAQRSALSLKGVAYNDPASNPYYTLGPYGGLMFWIDTYSPQQMVNVTDMLTKIKGRHTIMAGFNFITGYFARTDCNGCAGEADFGAGQTGLPGASYQTGSAFASFLLGDAGGGFYHFPGQFSYGAPYYAWFVQDTFKVTRKLTINMGLRYELPFFKSERYQRQSNFCPSCSNPAAGGILGAVTFAGYGPGRDGRKNFGNMRYNAWGPRLGIAYQVTHNTVLRAGGAIYYAPVRTGDNADTGHDGFAGNFSISSPNGYDPAFNLTTGFPPTTPPPNLDPGIDLFAAPYYIQPDAGMTPYFTDFNATVEHRFGERTLLTVGYQGTMGISLYSTIQNLNQLNPAYVSLLGSKLSLPAGSPDGLAALASVGKSLPWSTFPANRSVAQALLPWPQYTGFNQIIDAQRAGHSTYNALVVGLSHPFSHGLWAQISYTYSKLIASAEGLNPSLGGYNANGDPGSQNSYDRLADKSVSNEDVPQHIILSYVYNLPVGRGQRFLSKANTFTNAILGGWRFSGVQLYQSGFPLYVFSTQTNGVGTGERANLVLNQPLISPAWNGNPNTEPYLNAAAFSRPAIYTFGNTPRFFSNLRTPAMLNEDFSLAKDFPLPGGENRRIVFSANAFNAFNRVQFGGVNTTLESPTFGMFSSQTNAAREFQFMMRLEF